MTLCWRRGLGGEGRGGSWLWWGCWRMAKRGMEPAQVSLVSPSPIRERNSSRQSGSQENRKEQYQDAFNKREG